MNTAEQVIQSALEEGLIYTQAHDYAESGYSIGDKVGILFADWNPRNFDSKAKADNVMPRLAKVAERAGYECEWEDEWAVCDYCYRAIRTSPDSYDWQRRYWQNEDGEIVCADCVDPAEYLESLEGDSNRASTFHHVNPAEHGYVLLKKDMENGWHPGQNDSPKVVAKSLRGMGVRRFLFSADSVGQFDLSFSVYLHESEDINVRVGLRDKSLDLDVNAPDKVTQILRNAAEQFYESASELESAWQDKQAGKPWATIARELEKLAAKLDKML